MGCQLCELLQSRDAVIGVYDESGNVIETHEPAAESSMYTTLGSTLTITGDLLSMRAGVSDRLDCATQISVKIRIGDWLHSNKVMSGICGH